MRLREKLKTMFETSSKNDFEAASLVLDHVNPRPAGGGGAFERPPLVFRG